MMLKNYSIRFLFSYCFSEYLHSLLFLHLLVQANSSTVKGLKLPKRKKYEKNSKSRVVLLLMSKYQAPITNVDPLVTNHHTMYYQNTSSVFTRQFAMGTEGNWLAATFGAAGIVPPGTLSYAIDR